MAHSNKRCNICGELRPLGMFYAANGTRDGLRGDCKICFSARAAKRYREDPAKVKDRVQKWQRANADRVNESQRRRRARPEVKAKNREGHLQRKYGITQADYLSLLAKQDGGCAICGRKPSSKISLHVDHDHKTKRLRGLLCFRCNNAIGDFSDSAELIRQAGAYLNALDRPPELDARLAELKALRLEGELLRQE